jgi:hypothetical protein
VARRDISGVVDFGYLETYAGGDLSLVEEVLGLFQEQAKLWGPMLDASAEGWKDAAHTLKGAARGIGANALGAVCERAEIEGPHTLPAQPWLTSRPICTSTRFSPCATRRTADVRRPPRRR